MPPVDDTDIKQLALRLMRIKFQHPLANIVSSTGGHMTCEVVVMNKYAIVIAADSAITTISGNGNERYSKGGNKIFQLSRIEPVRVMIYGSATLDGVPWEIIIKNFRDALGKTKHGSLSAYATAFFEFIQHASFFFPQADLDIKLIEHALRAAIDLLNLARTSNPVISDNGRDIIERQLAWNDFTAQISDLLNRRMPHSSIASETMNNANAEVREKLASYPVFAEYIATEGLSDIISIDGLAELACTYLYKCYDSALPATGIVFSGFGDDQYFPAVIKFDVWGFLKSDFLYSEDDGNSCEISHNTPSGIFQFAMTSSIDTFTTGVGADTYAEVQRAYQQNAQALVTQVLSAHNINALPGDFHQTLSASASAFSDDWLNKMMAVHYHPMKRVIASLPIPEMVHLAETLIVLQSLKERITTHSESVGGPVDIAVITKSEGLVWIKRKHYFDADRNLQYTLRQRALYGDKA